MFQYQYPDCGVVGSDSKMVGCIPTPFNTYKGIRRTYPGLARLARASSS